MVWKTIKAVYGYAINVTTLENKPVDLFDEDNYIDYEILCGMFNNIKQNLDCTPTRILSLKDQPTKNDQLIKVYPHSMNGDGIAVGRRPVNQSIGGKIVNCWSSQDTIDNTYDYSIPEFDHYVDKSNFHHYNLLHTFHCCSDSMQKYVIIGVIYDEMDRNLFLDKTFDGICDKVFNIPTKVEDIEDPFFQHDSRDFISPANSVYGKYTAEIRSEPGVRKQELLNPTQSIKTYVNSFKSLYPYLGEPNCYLMLDDCTSCT